MEKPQKQTPTLLRTVADRLSRFFRKEEAPPPPAPEEVQTGMPDAPSGSVTEPKTDVPERTRRRAPSFDEQDHSPSVADMPSALARATIEKLVTAELGNEDFDVLKMAARLKTSRTNLYLIMRREYKMTPAAYIMERRLSHAVQLLDAKVPVRETCFKCGFSDPKYFSKVFRKYKGMLPSQYILTK